MKPAGVTGSAAASRPASTPPQRWQALEAVYRHIAATRMQGVPVLNPALQVQAVGFRWEAAAPSSAVGVLLTPWFMNLVRLPAQALPGPGVAVGAGATDAWLAVGCTASRDLGGHRFDFIGGFEPGLGAFEAASLFSPMFQFADQGAAVATACEVLRLLREAPAEPVAAEPAAAEPAAAKPATVAPAAPVPGPAGPARRGFLFGRSAGGAQ